MDEYREQSYLQVKKSLVLVANPVLIEQVFWLRKLSFRTEVPGSKQFTSSKVLFVPQNI